MSELQSGVIIDRVGCTRAPGTLRHVVVVYR